METNSHIKMAALAFLFIVALYIFFVYSNLQSTFVQDIANNSEVKEEGFNVPIITEGFKNERVVEGFNDSGSNTKEALETLETLVNQFDDSLNIKKYRKEYEELINKADDLFDLLKIQALTDLEKVDLKKNPRNALMTSMTLAMYDGAKPALESCLNFIDSK